MRPNDLEELSPARREEEARREAYRACFHRQHIQANGHAVEMCGFMTGHVTRAIAYCENAEIAEIIVNALKGAANAD